LATKLSVLNLRNWYLFTHLTTSVRQLKLISAVETGESQIGDVIETLLCNQLLIALVFVLL